MIKIFCKGLPQFLSQELFNEYRNEVREFEFLYETYPDTYAWIEDSESVKWLLASAIYYRKILAPLNGAHDFLKSRIKTKITQVRIGDFKFTYEESIRLEETLKSFVRILTNFGISISLFDYENIENFLRSLKNYKQFLERHGET